MHSNCISATVVRREQTEITNFISFRKYLYLKPKPWVPESLPQPLPLIIFIISPSTSAPSLVQWEETRQKPGEHFRVSNPGSGPS